MGSERERVSERWKEEEGLGEAPPPPPGSEEEEKEVTAVGTAVGMEEAAFLEAVRRHFRVLSPENGTIMFLDEVRSVKNACVCICSVHVCM